MALYTKFEGPSTDFVVKKGTSSLMVYDTKGTFLSSSTYLRILFHDGMYEWDAKSGKMAPVYPAPSSGGGFSQADMDRYAQQEVAKALAIKGVTVEFANGRTVRLP